MTPAPSQPPTPAPPDQVRRARWISSGVALLLAMLVAELGLVARMAVAPGAHHAGSRAEGAGKAGECPPKDQRASRPESLDEILTHPDVIPTHDHELLGRPAPDFELADLAGKLWNRSELQDGRPMVLIFYYDADCVSCARQLLDINADLPLFREFGARVVAISADAPELTRRRRPEYAAFGFPVLSDPGNTVAKAYGVFQRAQDGKMASIRCLCARRRCHGTFVVDRSGTVQWVNTGDMPLRRDRALLCQLAKIEGRLPVELPGATPGDEAMRGLTPNPP